MNDLRFIARPDGSRLALVRQAPAALPRQAVLVIHGATFPTSLSAAYRIDGRSWFDELCAAGFETWGLDFQGFGASDPFSEVSDGAVPGRARDAALQIRMAVDFIRENSDCASLALVAHSWGTVPAGILLSQPASCVDRAVFYGPVVPAESRQALPASYPPFLEVTREMQWAAFSAGVPAGLEPPVGRAEFDRWAESYVPRVPAGPAFDIECARLGDVAYDPGKIGMPVLVVRGTWDAVTSAADAARLFDALPSNGNRLVTIEGGTHRMHLERARMAFFRAVEEFLSASGEPPRLAPSPVDAARTRRSTRPRGPQENGS